MPYAVLEQKLRAVPEQYFEQLSAFMDLLLSLPNQNSFSERKPSGHPIFGLARGEFRYPDDLNLGDAEVAQMFGV